MVKFNTEKICYKCKKTIPESKKNNSIDLRPKIINNRKIFGYKTPTEMLKEELNNDKLFNKILNIQKELNVV